MQLYKNLDKALLFVFAGMFIFGAVFFIGGFLICTNTIKYNYEVPLADISDIAVDSSGDIYVETSFYGKVQVYNSKGKFLRNWPAFSGGKIDMDITDDENIVVASEKEHKLITFDKFGKILGDSILGRDFSVPDSLRKVYWVDSVKYEAVGFLSPEIVTTFPAKSVIVKQSGFLNLINGNSVWVFCLIGLGGFRYLKKRKPRDV